MNILPLMRKGAAKMAYTAQQQIANCHRWAELLEHHAAVPGHYTQQNLHIRTPDGNPAYCAWGLAFEALSANKGAPASDIWTPFQRLGDGTLVFRPAQPWPDVAEAFGLPAALFTVHCAHPDCTADLTIQADDLSDATYDAIPDCHFSDDGASVTVTNLSDGVGPAGWNDLSRFLKRHAADLASRNATVPI